jgi:hypothetical protein
MTIFTEKLKADILARIFNSVSETEAPPFWAGKFWGKGLQSRFGAARKLGKTARY